MSSYFFIVRHRMHISAFWAFDFDLDNLPFIQQPSTSGTPNSRHFFSINLFAHLLNVAGLDGDSVFLRFRKYFVIKIAWPMLI